MVVPGCCDFFNQGARDTVPERFRDRKSYFHNPVATLVRLSAEEGVELGRMIAERLAGVDAGRCTSSSRRAGSRSPTPRAATSTTRAADRALIDALRAALRPDFAYEEVDAHVDDPAFADLVADRYLTLVKEPAHAG